MREFNKPGAYAVTHIYWSKTSLCPFPSVQQPLSSPVNLTNPLGIHYRDNMKSSFIFFFHTTERIAINKPSDDSPDGGGYYIILVHLLFSPCYFPSHLLIKNIMMQELTSPIYYRLALNLLYVTFYNFLRRLYVCVCTSVDQLAHFLKSVCSIKTTLPTVTVWEVFIFGCSFVCLAYQFMI